MQTAFPFEIKQLTNDGEFEGYASTYGGEPDAVNDIVDKGAFTKTLASSKERPLLWQHRDPIGIVTLADSPAGLKAKGKLTLAVRQAAEAYALLKDRAVQGLSIGFQTIDAIYDGNGVRHLKELKLYEVSLTPFPCNSSAQVAAVKSADLARIHTALQEFKSDVLAVLGTKASGKTKRVDGEDLTSDCFAYAGDPEDPETWKLPIQFSTEEKTKSHIRNALARFGQTQTIPASERPKVLARIRAAAKKYGIGNY